MKWMTFTTFLLLLCLNTTAQSDQRAIELANEVMEAMGGQDAWEGTRFLQWNFFGRRMWWWDKPTGDVRLERTDSDLRIAMNVHDTSGQVFVHGEIQTSPDSLSKYLDLGYKAWINDSYWLIMPYKLQDPGVTLSYAGKMENMNGEPCEVLELQFDNVGVTPQNKYLVYIDTDSHLVVQWDYFRTAEDPEPAMQTPWADYNKYGEILLSGDRGRSNLTDIAVYDTLPEELFRNVAVPAEDLLSDK